MHAGLTGWLPAQQHSGHNIGDTDTHVIFVELEDGNAAAPPPLSDRSAQEAGGRHGSVGRVRR